MKNRLILVEGIPGSGKSTIASKIKEYFESRGAKVKVYNEGDSHPADLAWSACLTINEYNQIVKENPDLKNKLMEHTQIEGEYAIVAYTKLGLPMKSKLIADHFEPKEIYDGKVNLEIFKLLHFRRWRAFAKNVVDDDCVHIFECAYLQNHINELMGIHCMSLAYIKDYMLELINTVKCLNPKLIYLTQPNVEETIERVAKERVSPDKNKWDDWIDLVIRYIEKTKYAQVNELKGYGGAIQFFKDRKTVEEKIIEKLDIDKAVIYNINYDWDKVFHEVVSQLNILED